MSEVLSLDRYSAKVDASFNPRRKSHVDQVLASVEKEKGSGWEIESYDERRLTLNLVRQAAITNVTDESGGEIRMNLASGAKETDGDRYAAKYEDYYRESRPNADPPYRMVKFDTYLGFFVMRQMSDAEVRCRGAVAAALGVKPWHVECRQDAGGGFLLELPKYSPKQHLEKLTEVAEQIVGKPGWYVEVDASRARPVAEFIPADPPMFLDAYPYPFNRSVKDPFTIPVGIGLGGNGVKNFPLDLDLSGTVGVLVQGLAGAGKSVAVNAILYGSLAAGHEIVIVDVPHKATDFDWAKDFVRDGGWGCESKAAAVAAVGKVYKEGQLRGQILREYGVQKWQELPEHVRKKHPIITVFADELTGLLTVDPEPKSLPKDHPVRVEARQVAAERDLLSNYLSKMPAEMRAAGIRVVEATQQAQSNTGITPMMKVNIPNRIMLGTGATKQQKSHALMTPEAAPDIPPHLAENKTASRGVGIAEFEGEPSAIFKSYFATPEEYRSRLEALGIPKTRRPEPSAQEIDEFVPRVDGDDDAPPPSRLDSGAGFGAPDGRDAPETRLRGAAAAAHESKKLAAQAQQMGQG